MASRAALAACVLGVMGVASCGGETARPRAVDLVDLHWSNPLRAREVQELLTHAQRSLEACADPVRERIGGLDEGRLHVTIALMAGQGTLAVERVVAIDGPAANNQTLATCVRTALSAQVVPIGGAETFRGSVVVHLCIKAARPSLALAVPKG